MMETNKKCHHQADLGLPSCGAHEMSDLWRDAHLVINIKNPDIQPTASPTLPMCFHIPENKYSCEVTQSSSQDALFS